MREGLLQRVSACVGLGVGGMIHDHRTFVFVYVSDIRYFVRCSFIWVIVLACDARHIFLSCTDNKVFIIINHVLLYYCYYCYVFVSLLSQLAHSVIME